MERKARKRPAKAITIAEARDIRDALLEKDVTGKRDCMLFDIAYTTGYRIQDLIDLKYRDLKSFMELGYFSITEKKKVEALKRKLLNKKYDNEIDLSIDEVISKKIRPREVIIVDELGTRLKSYVKGKRSREYAFQSMKCKKGSKEKGTAHHISREAYSKIVKSAAEQCDIYGVSGHSLRKGYACNIYEETGDIFLVKEMLGHSSIEITKRYIGLERKEKDEASKSLNKLFR